MQTEQIDWTGQAIGDFIIEDLVSDGPFSWVYKASHRTRNAEHVALKISKPDNFLDTWEVETVFPTRALARRPGGVFQIRPDAAQLLLLQSENLRGQSQRLVAARDVICEDDRCIVQMEWLEGPTVREVMNLGPLPLSLVLELAQSLESLTSSEQSLHHGDIKPDNIMVTTNGIKLLDPGHFGPLDSQEGVIDNCMVTTPSYYPLLTPDDIFAVGIICWEAACRAHPMDGLINSQAMDLSNTGEELYAFVRARELTGEYFLTPILQAVRPSIVRPGMPAEMEEFLLEALRLRVCADGRLDMSPGFATFSDMIERLQSLLANGIHEF